MEPDGFWVIIQYQGGSVAVESLHPPACVAHEKWLVPVVDAKYGLVIAGTEFFTCFLGQYQIVLVVGYVHKLKSLKTGSD